MSDTVDAGAAAPASESVSVSSADTSANTPAVETVSTPETPAAPPSIDDSLRGIWDKNNPKRDILTGKFAPRTATPAEAAAVTTEITAEEAPAEPATDQPNEPAAETTAVSSIAPPNSWSAEKKALWANVPPDLQSYIGEREAQAHQAITRAGEQIKAFEPLARVLQQHGDTFTRNNLQPHDGVARLLAMESWLGQDPVTAVKEIAKAYGVDLTGLNQQQPAQPAVGEQGTPAQDPRVSTVQAELAETKAELKKVTSYLTAQQREQIESSNAALARQIADFAKERPHFEAVRKHMGALMSADESLTLEQAYDQASYAIPEIRNRILADQRKTDEDKKAKERAAQVAAAKKAGSVNVKSATGTGQAPKSMDDTLREVAARRFA